MSHYIEFPTDEEGVTLLVEADDEDVIPPPGVDKAGLFRGADGNRTVAVATVTFNDAVTKVIGENVRAVTDAIGQLAVKPAEIELTFALKATGEVGNIAIAKVGAEASFGLRLLWKSEPAVGSTSPAP